MFVFTAYAQTGKALAPALWQLATPFGRPLVHFWNCLLPLMNALHEMSLCQGAWHLKHHSIRQFSHSILTSSSRYRPIFRDGSLEPRLIIIARRLGSGSLARVATPSQNGRGVWLRETRDNIYARAFWQAVGGARMT